MRKLLLNPPCLQRWFLNRPDVECVWGAQRNLFRKKNTSTQELPTDIHDCFKLDIGISSLTANVCGKKAWAFQKRLDIPLKYCISKRCAYNFLTWALTYLVKLKEKINIYLNHFFKIEILDFHIFLKIRYGYFHVLTLLTMSFVAMPFKAVCFQV